jgi:hypothetical protein
MLWLLAILSAGTAHADYGYLYAFVIGSTSPYADAPRSLNPYGPITVQHTSTGVFVVTFSNSGIGENWNALANAASAGPGDYCNVFNWNVSTVTVRCYGPGGVAADSDFMVFAVSSANDKSIYFAFDEDFSPSSSSPSPNYSYNPSGTIIINHPTTGLFKLAFNGLGATGGTVQVGAYGSNDVCTTGGWTGSGSVNVKCYDPSGNATDTAFVIAIVPPGSTPSGLAYTYEDNPTYSGNYTPPSAPTYNPTGYAVSITRQSTGEYQILFNGMSSVALVGGLLMATADGTSARCDPYGWSNLDTTGAFQASVHCSDRVGNYIDTNFEVLVLPPMGYAYALIPRTSGAADQESSMNPGGIAITTVHQSTGTYLVSFPNSGIGPGWAVQAISLSTNWCKIGGWGANGATVYCFTPAGVAADSTFEVLAVSTTNEESIAFAWAGSPTTASYAPDPSYSYNPAGTISITRSSTGFYAVVFEGLNASGGTVQIGAYGSSATTCTSAGWTTPNFQADVACYDSNGNPADSAFTITVISGGEYPSNLAYAFADLPTSTSYTAPSADSYDAGGAVKISRSGTGSYDLSFPGFTANGLAFVQVTPFDVTARCSAPQPAVNCYTMAGAPADVAYIALTLGGIAGVPGQMFVSSGGNQSAVVTTAFGTALSVTVEDTSGHPVVGSYVTFTAPTSGASGTFYDPFYLAVSTVTVATDSGGVATAPQFTANSTTGSYTVNVSMASFPGGAPPVSISLTNAPLTPITLQTSPAALKVSLAGSAYAAAPVTTSMAGGSSQTIAAQSPQIASNGIQYVWTKWSDGGAISHNITVPASATTYTASFKTQYYLFVGENNNSEGSVTGAGYYDANTNATVSATPAAGFRFASWQGSVANASSATTTVDMTGALDVTANFALSCAVTGDGNPSVTDVQAMVNQVLGHSTPKSDLNSDGVVNVIDIQIVLNAALGKSCSSAVIG